MGRFQEDLETYMDAGIPMLYVDTMEYDKIEDVVKKIAKRNRRNMFYWGQRGFRSIKNEDVRNEKFPSTSPIVKQPLETSLELLLKEKADILSRCIILLEDVHFLLDKPEIISRLRELAYLINQGEYYECTVIIVSPLENIPKELESYLTVMMPDYMSEHEIKDLIKRIVSENNSTMPEESLLEKLVMMLKGMTETEICNTLALVLTKGNVIEASDMYTIMEQKQQMVKKSGIIEIKKTEESMDNIGGLENLKQWLLRKRDVLKDIKKAQEFGVDIPKGVLIAGMPGCGKSMTAKATATAFSLPLLCMDMGRLMGKYVGESEGNMRRALRLTEATSPCVLWIDELEKAFAGVKAGGGGSEVTTRLFGNFLTWMNDKKSLTFVVATANDISQLPPELMRKGRFDEIFYVGFPNEQERKMIFENKIKERRKDDLDKIDLNLIASKTDGYSGADIEGVVRDAVETAFVEKKKAVTTEDLLKSIKKTSPISETMKDQIEKMKVQYEEKKFTNASR